MKEAVKAESFTDFKKRALAVTGDYNKNWLKAEYKAAKARVRSAKNYQDALADQDLYPNIEYMPSRAVHPRQEHKDYYHTILPIIHPWWDAHMPPNVWGCECWWRTTDEGDTGVPTTLPKDVSPGLDIHPGKTGRVFSNTHPYFVDMDQAAASILRENVAAIHGVDPEDLTLFLGHKESKGCVYSLEKLGARYEANVEIGKLYAAQGNGVQLMAAGDITSRINGIWNTFKISSTGTVSSIDKAVRKVNSDLKKRNVSGDITLKFMGNPVRGILIDALKSRFTRLKPNHIERIHFVIGDTYQGSVTAKEVISGKLPF